MKNLDESVKEITFLEQELNWIQHLFHQMNTKVSACRLDQSCDPSEV